jgi:glycosyltransferase involved in cell wall biosynthesis
MGQHYYRRLAERAMARSRMVTISYFVKDEILAKFPRADVTVVSPMPGLRDAPPDLSVRRNRPYILSIGTVEPRKNLHSLVSAFDRSGLAQDLDLVIAGRRGWGSLPRSAVLLESMTDPQMRTLVEGAVALFAPSLYEGFGLPAVEAISLGTPVYCSDIPVFRETAPESRGFFDPTSAESIVEALREAAGLPVERARPPTSQRYSRERTQRELRALYKGTARRHSPTPGDTDLRETGAVSGYESQRTPDSIRSP